MTAYAIVMAFGIVAIVYSTWALSVATAAVREYRRFDKRADRRMLAMRTMALISSDRIRAGRPA